MKPKKEELVSVILSVYNDEQNIVSAIKSILNQTYKNLELLVLDDASTDNSLSEIRKISDPRLKIFENKINLGLTKSLNKLIFLSNGELIARQDSDDESLPNRIQEQVEFIQVNNLELCTTRAFIKNSRKKIPKYTHLLPFSLISIYKNPFIHGTLLIKKTALKDVGFYNEEYHYAQDYKLYLDLFKKNYKLKILNKPLYVLNTINNISSTFQKEQKYFFKLARKGLNKKS